MWAALIKFLGSPVAKIGGLAFKGWQIILAATIVAAAVGTTGYVAIKHNETRDVVILIGGVNTSIENCWFKGEPSDGETFGALNQSLIHVGYTFPYLRGCPTAALPYTSSGNDIAVYSYATGSPGTMAGDYWAPANYGACDPNTHTLEQDIKNLETMIEKYRGIYPNARFHLVGHSLGGLVALIGAADYVRKYDGTIAQVITLDSPLHGRAMPGSNFFNVALPALTSAALNIAGLCYDPNNLLGQTFNAMGQGQGNDAENLVGILASHGVPVYTLGNVDDCLYKSGLCLSTAFGDPDVTTTQFVDGAYQRQYSLGSSIGGAEVIPGVTLFGGHGAIMLDPGTTQEISWLLTQAPSVTLSYTTSPGADHASHQSVLFRWRQRRAR